jgi:hypothetical protein
MKPSADSSDNVFWDPTRDAKLRRLDGQVRASLDPTVDAADPSSEERHTRLMERARLKAAEHCLRALDQTLGELSLSRRQWAQSPLPIPPFGTLRFVAEGDELEQHLRVEFDLAQGKMVNRRAILAYEQELFSSYTAPSSLGIALFPHDGGTPLVLERPNLRQDTLVWQTAGAALGAYWRDYRPRLDCFAAAGDTWEYQVGQAASADAAPAIEPSDPSGQATIFSSEDEGENAWVVGIEWRDNTPTPDFDAFKQRLGLALGEMRVPFTCVSEFPASGRIYLSLAPADRPQLEACLDQLNRTA